MLKFFNKLIEYFFIRNKPIYNLGFDGIRHKRAMLSYLTDSYHSDSGKLTYNTNRLECLTLASVLNQLGFIVDIYNCQDTSYKKKGGYDLVLGFGYPFRAEKRFTKKSILYLTEAPPQLSYENERNRVSFFNLKYQRNLKIERSGTYYQEDDLNNINGIICLGNGNRDFLKERLSQNIYKNIVTGIDPKITKKDFGKGDLLWFGSRGAIHKGLDLALEAVEEYNHKYNTSLKLHICGVTKKTLRKVISIDKYSCAVHHGYVSVYSPIFEKILSECTYAILPSCSEGMSTSILTCMRHGLLPIMTKECNVEIINGFGAYIKQNCISSIVEAINHLENTNRSLIDYINFIKASNELYSLGEFNKSTYNILKGIIRESK